MASDWSKQPNGGMIDLLVAIYQINALDRFALELGIRVWGLPHLEAIHRERISSTLLTNAIGWPFVDNVGDRSPRLCGVA